jgi:hypothetical protein
MSEDEDIMTRASILLKLEHLEERISNPPSVVIDQIVQLSILKPHVFQITQIYSIFNRYLGIYSE